MSSPLQFLTSMPNGHQAFALAARANDLLELMRNPVKRLIIIAIDEAISKGQPQAVVYSQLPPLMVTWLESLDYRVSYDIDHGSEQTTIHFPKPADLWTTPEGVRS